jgi:hypothetical protein
LAVRIAAALKTSEHADPTFADRVMRAVRNEQRSNDTSTSWWNRAVPVGGNPLAALAIAASVVAIVLATGARVGTSDSSAGVPPAVAAQRDTARVVRFVFVAPGASRVAVVGDFNHWDVNAHHLLADGKNGVWTTSVPLMPGRHEYAFVIDGGRWAADPAAAATIRDEFGGETSVVTVHHPTRPQSG